MTSNNKIKETFYEEEQSQSLCWRDCKNTLWSVWKRRKTFNKLNVQTW